MLKKTLATIGLVATLAIPAGALAATVDDDTVTPCPYAEDGEFAAGEAMARNRGQVRLNEDCDGSCVGTGVGPANGYGHGARDGSGPLELGSQDGTGYRHGTNR